MHIRYLRFEDLRDAGIVRNRPTLYRWMNELGFPRGILLGPNSRAWPEEEVLRWLSTRPSWEHGA